MNECVKESNYEIDYYNYLISDEIQEFEREIKSKGEACAYAFKQSQANIIAKALQDKGYDVEPVFNRKTETYEIYGVVDVDEVDNSYKAEYLTLSELSELTSMSKSAIHYYVKDKKLIPVKQTKFNRKTNYYFTHEQAEMLKQRNFESKCKILCIDKHGKEYKFINATDVERRSKDLFGIKLIRQNVKRFLDKDELYKGFAFKTI